VKRFAFVGICALAVGCADAISSTQTVSNLQPINDIREVDEPLSVMNAPRLVITKKDRKLELFDGDKLVKTYAVSLGFAPDGDKEKQGDGKTPEGEFYIFTKNPKSRFYLSLGISYPSTDNAVRGLREGLISQSEYDQIIEAIKQGKIPLQYTKLGGEIYLHGGGTAKDWTWGCIALADRDIKELFNALPVGTPVTIRP